MQTTNKTLTTYKKAYSSLGRILKMVEDGEYCIDIMQQNLAVIGLLKSAHKELMEGHLDSCFKNAMSTNNEKRKKEMVEEIMQVTNLFNK